MNRRAFFAALVALPSVAIARRPETSAATAGLLPDLDALMKRARALCGPAEGLRFRPAVITLTFQNTTDARFARRALGLNNAV